MSSDAKQYDFSQPGDKILQYLKPDAKKYYEKATDMTNEKYPATFIIIGLEKGEDKCYYEKIIIHNAIAKKHLIDKICGKATMIYEHHFNGLNIENKQILNFFSSLVITPSDLNDYYAPHDKILKYVKPDAVKDYKKAYNMRGGIYPQNLVIIGWRKSVDKYYYQKITIGDANAKMALHMKILGSAIMIDENYFNKEDVEEAEILTKFDVAKIINAKILTQMRMQYALSQMNK